MREHTFAYDVNVALSLAVSFSFCATRRALSVADSSSEECLLRPATCKAGARCSSAESKAVSGDPSLVCGMDGADDSDALASASRAETVMLVAVILLSVIPICLSALR